MMSLKDVMGRAYKSEYSSGKERINVKLGRKLERSAKTEGDHV